MPNGQEEYAKEIQIKWLMIIENRFFRHWTIAFLADSTLIVDVHRIDKDLPQTPRTPTKLSMYKTLASLIKIKQTKTLLSYLISYGR